MTTHVQEHCRKPRWRRGRWRNTPWVCSCGKAWLMRYESHYETVICRWYEWKPWEK